MSLAGFCLSGKEPTHENAIAAIDGNICRCTGYKSIARAASKIADLLSSLKKDAPDDPAGFSSKNNILPDYFSSIKNKLISFHTNGVFHAASSAPQWVGGGTDLYVQKHDEMTHVSGGYLFDRPGWKSVITKDNTCFIGGAATVSDLKNSSVINEAFPAFQQYAKLVSSTPIRNMATIAGNFINASPIGDFTIFFLALDAQLQLSNGENTRTIPLRKLYRGYKTLDKKPEEYIEQVSFELPGQHTLFCSARPADLLSV
jgi:xanthine dehydrogenase small subunit